LRSLDGIAIAVQFAPELVLVDLQLPDVSGHVVARQLRQRAGRSISIVAITGGDSTSLALAGAFDEHARKPVSAARLYQLLDIARDAARTPSDF